MDVAIDRLPHSSEAERAILGAILLDNQAMAQASPILRPGDFQLDSNRRIFGHMVEMNQAGTPIDFVTLIERLGAHKEIESVGNVAYITSLTDGLPRVKHIGQYVKIVKDKYILRQLMYSAIRTLQMAQDADEPAQDILGKAQTDLIQLVYDEFKEYDLEEIARETMEELHMLRQSETSCIGASSGINELDVMTTGYRKGEITVIGARPGNGKTALACQSIRRNIKRGWKVGFFSSEVPRDQIMIRLACMETGIQVFDTRDPRVLSAENYSKLQEAIAFFATEFNDKLFIDDTPCVSMDRLLAKARAWISKGVNLLFGDYLQIFDAANPKWRTEQERVSNTMMAWWNLARSTKTPCVVLSQLNRTAHNTRPDMASLRSSGTIENFAQTILLLWRDFEFDESGEQVIGATGKDEIIITKQRSGPANITMKASFEKEVGLWTYRM